MVENHGRFAQDSRRVEKLVIAVDHPNFGVLIDMGNFVCVDEDNSVAVGRLAPYAFHCHAKDFHLKPGTATFPGTGWNVSRGGNYWRGAIIGHGDVPLMSCIRALKQSGYDGVMAIEFEGMEDPLTGVALGQENLLKLIDMA
jgi:sugar phosphate isomerase/epimerase